MTKVPRRAYNTPWALNNGQNIGLITAEELLALPLGTVLYSISGEMRIVGKDRIDQDTRYGVLAYGLLIESVICVTCSEIAADPEVNKRPGEDHRLFVLTGHFPECKQAP